ncbi:TetR/AcrR family transcriptional regulator [Zavarzinia sp.]|uniref:TetR/AcrR family transcriptional regulator n=1 Tax=Zavarzinia sp. TaxID=2027920 RepID=UPI00356567E4
MAAAEKRLKGENTAGRILTAALDLFSRYGFDQVTMTDVGRAARVAQSAVHYHFETKDQLWRAALLSLKDGFVAEERMMLAAGKDADPLAQLKLSMRLFLHMSMEAPALGRIVMMEGMIGGPRLTWMVKELMAPRYAALVEIARRAIAAGQLKPHPPEQLVIMLHAAAASFFTLAPLMREAFGIDVDDPARRTAQEALIMDSVFAGITTNKG